MNFVDETSGSIYHDTVSIGGGAMFPQTHAISTVPLSDPPDMNPESSIIVDVPSATSECNQIFFNVRTTITLLDMSEKVFAVQRLHDDFIWLHNYLKENELYAGYIIPPAPPHLDMETAQNKLRYLRESEGVVSQEQYRKMKADIESEFAALFSKATANHHLFLQRLASHPVFRRDHNFRVFLEYDGCLSVRTKTHKEKAADFFKYVTKNADEAIRLANQRDDDPFFAEEKHSVSAYNSAVKAAYNAAESSVRNRRAVAEQLDRVHVASDNLLPRDRLFTSESDLVSVMTNFYKSYQTHENRLASDEGLILCNTLRYYTEESSAAKDLLYRRSKALADYEAANRALDRARSKMRDVQAAENAQFAANDRFKSISETARIELEEFKARRIDFFQKNLLKLAQVEARRAQNLIELTQSTLDRLRKVPEPAENSSSNPPATTALQQQPARPHSENSPDCFGSPAPELQ